MAVINGTLMRLLLDGVAIAAAKSCTLNINTDTPDASSKSSGGWAQHIQGLRSWDVSFDGLYDPTGTLSFEQLYDEINGRTSVVMELAQIDGTGGGEVYRGTASVTSVSINAEMEAPVTLSGTLTGNGALAKGTVVSS